MLVAAFPTWLYNFLRFVFVDSAPINVKRQNDNEKVTFYKLSNYYYYYFFGKVAVELQHETVAIRHCASFSTV